MRTTCAGATVGGLCEALGRTWGIDVHTGEPFGPVNQFVPAAPAYSLIV